jgi:Uma2 family endonuclease
MFDEIRRLLDEHLLAPCREISRRSHGLFCRPSPADGFHIRPSHPFELEAQRAAMTRIAASRQTHRRTRRITIPRPDRSGPLTYDDFCVLVPHAKADLMDGVIYIASPEGTDANELFVWLLRILADYLDSRGLGKVFGSRVALRLGEKNGPEPDLAIVLTEHLDRVLPGHILGPCDLAMEIVTPDSAERDYKNKRERYEQAGVLEYWIVDDQVHRLTVFRWSAKGYKKQRPRKGIQISRVLPGFRFRQEWLWQNPRRRVADVVAEILAGVPS